MPYRRVSPRRLFWRALLLRCPACGRPTLVRGLLKIHDRCAFCGLLFEHDEGFFLGALIVNYTVTAVVGIVPAIVLVATGTWSTGVAIAYAVVMCLLVPVLFYWHAKSLWMATFYSFVPEDLAPENRPREEDEQAMTAEQEELNEAISMLEGGRRPARRR